MEKQKNKHIQQQKSVKQTKHVKHIKQIKLQDKKWCWGVQLFSEFLKGRFKVTVAPYVSSPFAMLAATADACPRIPSPLIPGWLRMGFPRGFHYPYSE